MHVYDCEITREHYKILKACHGKHHVSYEKLADKFCSPHSPLSYYRFNNDFSFLRSHDFLLQDDSVDKNGIHHFHDKVCISSIGENTYSIMREEKLLFWKKLLLQRWLDVVVAFITAGITADHWQSIKVFFANLLSAFFK